MQKLLDQFLRTDLHHREREFLLRELESLSEDIFISYNTYDMHIDPNHSTVLFTSNIWQDSSETDFEVKLSEFRSALEERVRNQHMYSN